MKSIKFDNYSDVPYNYTGIVEYKNGSIEYYLNGEYHREDGPAVIFSNGRKDWYLKDKRISTEKVNEWIIENNISNVWTNSHKLLFKLTFG